MPAPKHIAIIMDGNGRWAKERGKVRLDGHRAGAESVRKTVTECRKLGVEYLTLFSFSTENWGRAEDEVSGLMKLFTRFLNSELNELMRGGIRLRAIGDLSRLPKDVRTLLERDIEETKNNTGMTLILALSYGAREELVAAARNLARKAVSGEIKPEEIDERVFADSLWTADIPDPDLLIRTSGELRISNFLLWQIAYSEIVVVNEYWPDFSPEVLKRCLAEFEQRERRYGLTSEQLKAQTEAAAP